MPDRLSKIRAFTFKVLVWVGIVPAWSQVSGVGVLTPVQLENPALVGQYERQAWLGYEPSRFGLPELHWGILGVVLPVAEGWSAGAELRGRTAEEFSQLGLRNTVGIAVTNFFRAGAAVEVVRYAVRGMPARWWGKLDLGVRVAVTSRLRVGVAVGDGVPWRWGSDVGDRQRVTLGLGWEGEEGWGAAVDAVIATLELPTLHLNITIKPTKETALALRLSTSPPQVYSAALLQLWEYALEIRLGFHAALGWSKRLVLLYRWGT